MGTQLTHNFYYIIEDGTVSKTDNKPQMNILAIDGSWGSATTRRLREYFNTIKDGVISGQTKCTANEIFHRYNLEMVVRILSEQCKSG